MALRCRYFQKPSAATSRAPLSISIRDRARAGDPRGQNDLARAEVRASTLPSGERGTFGRWHVHCAIELPRHFDAVAFET